MDFTGKVVIVTGASSGIGAASAVLFAKCGANLTLVGRNEQRLNEVAKKCYEARGNQPLSLILDLTHQGSCDAVVARTVATFQKINVLVNCAGRVTIGSLFDDHMEAFNDMVDINLKVPYKLTHLAVPYLAKTKGNIVNLTSTKYTRVRHGFLGYAIAKAGLEKLTKIAALELATEGIRVNSVQPGLTRTNILSNLGVTEDYCQHAFDGLSKEMTVIEPENVAKMVVFVASETCPSLNGAEMAIDAATSIM